MAISLYNSLSRKREVFEPLNAPDVKIYACGPTVYDLLHVGNFRGVIVFSFVCYWLEARGFKVNFVYNFTDVDDKILARAARDKVPAKEITEKYIAEFLVDFGRLGLRPHDLNPKVTETMPEIQSMISTLIEKENAYVVKSATANQDVNYSIRSFPEYGKLSGRNPEDLLAAVRIEKDDKKKDPLDFALWKSAKPGEELSWSSPWGEGRPGWHIECSAMIKKHLGDAIDIHCGGMDLIFPHHENEIAQSEAATGKHFAKYWMHNNMINFGGAKMSKSLGNIKTARGFMDEYSPEILKYMILSVHYRSTLDLSPDSVDLAIAGLARIYSALSLAEAVVEQAGKEGLASGKTPDDFVKATGDAWKKAEEAFDEDFNSAEAMARLFEVVRLFNSKVRRGAKSTEQTLGLATEFLNFTKKFGHLLALFKERPNVLLRALDDRLLVRADLKREDIDALVAQRSEARTNKDFAKSDELRKALTEKGISVQDLPDGSYWEVSK